MIRLAIIPIGMSRLRIFRFLGRGRDGIEPDEGEKDNRGAAHHPAKPLGMNGCQFVGLTMKAAEGNNENDDRDLGDYDDRCWCVALSPNAVDEQESSPAATMRNAGRLRAIGMAEDARAAWWRNNR